MLRVEIYIISLLPIIFYLFLRLKKAMHMLQQNWYDGNYRYFKWIFKYLKQSFNYKEIFVLLILVLSLFFSNNIFLINSLLYLILGFLFYKELKKEQKKKPLVITKRIKRLIVTISIIYILPLGFLFIYCGYLTIYYQVVSFILVFLAFLIVWLANIINEPIEKLVFNYYKRKATNKLKAMKGLKVIGITGSYGKTSTKNFLNNILNVKYNSFATPESFNTLNGLMRSINEYMDKFNDVFIAELGAFKQGDIKELSELVKPQYGIITNVGVAHLEIFKSQESIQKAKFELIEQLPSDGIGVLNKDDEYQTNYKIKNNCKIIWVGINNKKADYLATNIKMSKEGMKFDIIFPNDKKEYPFSTNLLGHFNIYNILSSVALGYELGLTVKQLQQGVKTIKSVPHRLELKKYGTINIIDDAYNSNPQGANMALEVLSLMSGKKIVVTPGMVDLGSEEYNLNKEFGKQIAKVADEVILIGQEQTKSIYEGLKEQKYKDENIYVLNDIKEAFKLFTKIAEKETYVLLENDLPDMFSEKE